MVTKTTDTFNTQVDTSAPMIEAEHLVAGYQDNIVWRDATFTVGRGEFVAVIGPNGAGKTTLFRLLLGLQHPLSGVIKIFGGKPKRGNPHIGYVPQKHGIDQDTNIECLELVRLAISGDHWGVSLNPGNERKIALDTLRSVGGEDLAHRSLGGLSGGELQRIFLAEALVSSPEILLLDEPLSNLDIRRSEELVKLVNSVVRSRNVSAFLVAHDINPLLPFLDDVIYIANGRVATGTPKDVFTSERLSALYGVHIEVVRDSKGNVAIIGASDKDADFVNPNRCVGCSESQ